jgi:hypothetical protein
VLHASFSTPDSLAERIAADCGSWPRTDSAYERAAAARVRYGADVLTRSLLPASRPAVAVFWSTVPDGIHHRYGLGHPAAVAGLREVDAVFRSLLAACESLYEAVNVLVTADHGYISVSGHIDLTAELIDAGYKRSRDSTELVVCVDGGAVSLYADAGVDQERLARWLLARPWASVLFSPHGRVAGTVPLEDTGGGGAEAPQLTLCLGWDDARNGFGVLGSGWGGGAIAVGAGDHGGLSPWEMQNTLIAAGPAFRKGLETDVPCGIVDIAPTALHCLGLPAPPAWQGRVLTEALEDGAIPATEPPLEIATVCLSDAGPVRQTLRLQVAGGVRYPAAAWRSSPA